MTDLEVSKALALAIGYQPKHLNSGTAQQWVLHNNMMKYFDYRDWYVIGPIAERFDCFPWQQMDSEKWVTDWASDEADTPQKAIALAVIQGAYK